MVTPDGLPLGYEVYAGNTHEAATLEEFLERVERRWGRARRTWLMDRGIPTERTLEKMRARSIDYLVGTPKGRLTKLERRLLEQPWVQARELVRLGLPQAGEAVTPAGFSYALDRAKLRQAIRREGRYLLRSNMRAAAPELVWETICC